MRQASQTCFLFGTEPVMLTAKLSVLLLVAPLLVQAGQGNTAPGADLRTQSQMQDAGAVDSGATQRRTALREALMVKHGDSNVPASPSAQERQLTVQQRAELRKQLRAGP
jgi:hypothetical protein